MSIRGIDANLTAGRVAEQSPQAAQSAKYHEMLLDKLAARAHAQEAINSTKAQSVNNASDTNADGGGLGGGGGDSGGNPKDRDAKSGGDDLKLPAGAVPKSKLDISV